MNLPTIDTTRGIHKTSIEWADYAVGSPFVWTDKATAEVVKNACIKCSAGCAACYAETIGLRFKTGRAYTRAEMDRLDIHLDQGVINSILRFKPKGPYKNGRDRPAVFLGDMTDLYGEWVPFEMLDTPYAAMALRPDVDFLILTKRAKMLRKYWAGRFDGKSWSDNIPDEMRRLGKYDDRHEDIAIAIEESGVPLTNVWHGVSVENQEQADLRIPHLLACSSAVRFVSYEPALGPVDFWQARYKKPNAGRSGAITTMWHPSLDWLIIGGESGPGARPFNVAWGEKAIEDCASASVPCFTKQMGSNPRRYGECDCGKIEHGRHHSACPAVRGEPIKLKDRKGADPSEWPEHLRVRQMPGQKEKA